MHKTMLRCCLAVLTYVALVLCATTAQSPSKQEASHAPRWTLEDLNVEDPQLVETTTSSEEAINASVEEESTMESETKCKTKSNKKKEDMFVASPAKTIKEDPKTLKIREEIATIVKARKKAIMAKISKADNDIASIRALTEQILKALKEKALKEEAAKANEESTKASHCEENEDPLDDPNLCLQAWTNFTRVLGQLKQRHEEVQDCAQAAGIFESLRQDQSQTSQDDIMRPPVDKTNNEETSSGPDHASPFIATTETEDVKTTRDKREKNDARSGKTAVIKRVQGDYGDNLQDHNAKKQRVMTTRSKRRMQGEDGDPHEKKKQRIRARVRFSLPTQKRRAMDDECDVGSSAKRRQFATSAESGGEMEDLQWMEHEKRMFRLEMLAEAKQYNDVVRFHQTWRKISQGQPHGAQRPCVRQQNSTHHPVVTPANTTEMETTCPPPILPVVVESAKETSCPPPIIPVVVKSAKETTCPPPILPVVIESTKEASCPPPIIPVVVKSAKETTCPPPTIPMVIKSAKVTTRPPIVHVVDVSAKRHRH